MLTIKHLFIITLFQLFLSKVENVNILFITTAPAKSHQLVFQAIWKELSLKGHTVYVITPNPLNDSKLVNLTEIDISSTYSFLYNFTSTLTKESLDGLLKRPDFLTTFMKDSFMTIIFSKLNEFVFKHENVQRFLEEDHHFDVCIIEWLFPTMAGFAAKYDCPFIGVTSTGAPIVSLDTLGNPSHPAYAPDHNLPVGRDMTFKERLMSTLYSVYVRVYYHLFVLPREDQLIKKYLGQDLPYLGDIEKNISLLLINRNLAFHRIMPTVPAVIELGGIQLNRTYEQLTTELKEYLDNSSNGVIYFSFGSANMNFLTPKNVRNVFFETFNNLPYNVLWKWNDDTLPGKPSNVLIQKWFPQIAVLKHPNVKLFIVAGGQQSIEDAIRSHVPILGFPIQSDQTHNVDTCRKYGMGLWMDFEDLTVANLNNSIHEIISNPKYKNNAAKLAELIQDLPDDGLQKAIWWIEYVIRHKGAKHLRSPVTDMSWFKYLLLDVIGFLLILILLSIFLLYLIFKIVYFIISKFSRKDIRDNDDKKIK